MGRIAAVIGAALLVLVAAACGERGEPTGPDTELYPVTVASPTGGKPLVLTTPAKRIAVIAPSVKRILDDLGATKAVAGMPLTQNESVDPARLRGLRPDLIVASSTTDDQTLAQAARAVRGVPVYQAPDDSIRGVEETITDLGVITARQSAASRLVREIEAKRDVVHTHLARAKAVTVFLTTAFFKGLASFETVSDQSLPGDLLREARGRNVAGNSTELSALQLVRLHPDWIIATSDSGTTLDKLRASKTVKTLAAVRTKHFTTVDARLLEPGPLIGQGLLELAKRLHPDAFR
jgi:ABC-type Fe3+-hydroxamate transport system substrate-binding protein